MALLNPFWLIAALALFLLALFARRPPGNGSWEKVMSISVLAFFRHRTNYKNKRSLLLLGGALAALALTSPATRQQNAEALQHASGWIAIADVSRSMTMDDVAPSRFSAMRDGIAQLTDYSGAKPLALIIYAGDAFLAVPPVFDKTLLKQHIALLDYGIVPQDGSNLTRALSLATAVIEDSGMLSARIFVFGDGANMNNSSNAAARHLASTGHRIDTILYGSQSGDSVTAADVKAAQHFVNAGAGQLVAANSLGAVNFAALDLNRNSEATQSAAMRALVWQNQSHWLLLLLLPIALLWFRQSD